MIAYASRTGTRRNLAELRRYDWRLLLSAAGAHRDEGFRFAIDNGAWSAYTKGEAWTEGAFARLMRSHGSRADWAVIPDIVAGGLASLDLSLRWMRRVLDECRASLLAVQDGMQPSDVLPFVGARVGIFVGGSTAWKLGTLVAWCDLARQTKCWLHVGRVNSAARIKLCAAAGATSFDGTSASRYAVTCKPLDAARRQLGFGGF